MLLLPKPLCLFCYAILAVFVLHNSARCDVLKDALLQYSHESRDYKDMDPEARMKFYDKWLYKFVGLIEDHKTSPYREEAITKALGLSTGLGKYDLSKKFSSALIESNSQDWHAQAIWHGESAEIARRQYSESRDMVHADDAIQSFKNALELISSHKTSISPGTDLYHKRPLYQMMLADLLSDAKKNYPEAADLYKSANELLLGMTDSEKQELSSINWDSEYASSREAYAAIQLDDYSRACQALESLESIPTLRWPPTFYFRNAITSKYPSGGNRYQELALEWLDTHKDQQVPFLMFDLARDYVRADDLMKALELYSDLRAEHWDTIITKDAESIERGRDGYSAEILYNLSRIYSELEMYELALKVLAEFEGMFPNDPRYESVKGMLTYVETELARRNRAILPDIDFSESPERDVIPGAEEPVQTPFESGTVVLGSSPMPASVLQSDRSIPYSLLAGIGLIGLGALTLIMIYRRRAR